MTNPILNLQITSPILKYQDFMTQQLWDFMKSCIEKIKKIFERLRQSLLETSKKLTLKHNEILLDNTLKQFLEDDTLNSVSLNEEQLLSLVKKLPFQMPGFSLSGKDYEVKAKDLGSGFNKHIQVKNLLLFDQLNRDFKRFPVYVKINENDVIQLGSLDNCSTIQDDVLLIMKTLQKKLIYHQSNHLLIQTAINLINQVTLLDASTLLGHHLNQNKYYLKQKISYFCLEVASRSAIKVTAFIKFLRVKQLESHDKTPLTVSISMTCLVFLQRKTTVIKDVTYQFLKELDNKK